MKKIDYFLVMWSTVSVLFWLWYSLVTKHIEAPALYFIVWVGIGGFLMWKYRHAIESRIRTWDARPYKKFLLLAFGAVLAEEVIAASAQVISGGLPFSLLFVRIGQFWLFNVLAFTGLIVGLCYLTRKLYYTKREIFYLACGWGLYAEGMIKGLSTNVMAVIFLFAPVMLSYGIILTPALLSGMPGKRSMPFFFKYILTYGVVFALTIPPILLISVLQHVSPWLFAPSMFLDK